MVWLCLESGISSAEVLKILCQYPVCWVLTDRLPKDSARSLLVTRESTPLLGNAEATVVVSLEKVRSMADNDSLLEGLLVRLGVYWQESNLYQQLHQKEEVIQQLLRYRATSLKFWLERWLRPFNRWRWKWPSFWSCFEKGQHLPRPLRLPPQVEPPHSPLTISLVTPSYQQAHFLERTLCSVLDQNYPWLEYWVQDGGSQDGSVELLRRYEGRLSGWESKPDSGQTEALNLGFDRCSGEVMGWLNSDDLLLPGALASVARFFQANPEVDAVYGHRVLIDAQDQEIGRWIVPDYGGDILSWADLVPQETLFWRRSLWEKVGGRLDPSYQFAMDWDLLLRFREVGARVAKLPRFLGGFRIHDHQKSSTLISSVGEAEMFRLRERSLGRAVDQATVFEAVCPFYRRAKWEHLLYRLGLKVIV